MQVGGRGGSGRPACSLRAVCRRRWDAIPCTTDGTVSSGTRAQGRGDRLLCKGPPSGQASSSPHGGSWNGTQPDRWPRPPSLSFWELDARDTSMPTPQRLHRWAFLLKMPLGKSPVLEMIQRQTTDLRRGRLLEPLPGISAAGHPGRLPWMQNHFPEMSQLHTRLPCAHQGPRGALFNLFSLLLAFPT